MKKNLKILLSVLLLVAILGLTGVVNAFSVSMKLDSSSKLKVGDIVEVTLKISNIDAGNGIDAIGATLEYDKNVFDEVTQDSFEGINNWNVGMYSTDTQMLTILRSSKVNTIGDVLKVSLRVKNTTNVNSTTIKYKEITVSGGAVSDGGTGDIEVSEAKITISKEIVTPPVTNTVTNETTNEVANTVVNKISNTVNTQINNTNGTTGKIPQTGENDMAIIIGISVVAIIAIVAFIKYRNLNIK